MKKFPSGTVNYSGSCNNGLPVLCQRKPTDWNSSNFANRHREDDKVAGVPFIPRDGLPIPPPFVLAEKKESTNAPKQKSKPPKNALPKSPAHFAQLQNPIYTLCSTTQSSLFIVMSQSFLPNQNYAAACAQFNLVPANLFSSKRGAAGVIFGACSTGDPNAVAAMINSFEAIEGSVLTWLMILGLCFWSIVPLGASQINV